METPCCVNTDCEYCDSSSETGCMADLSTWEDCQNAIFEEIEEDD